MDSDHQHLTEQGWLSIGAGGDDDDDVDEEDADNGDDDDNNDRDWAVNGRKRTALEAELAGIQEELDSQQNDVLHVWYNAFEEAMCEVPEWKLLEPNLAATTKICGEKS